MIWNGHRMWFMRLLLLLVGVLLVAPSLASAGLGPALCHPRNSDTSRGKIPASFAVEACFDGHNLHIYNNLDLALGVAITGSVGNPTRTESNFDLAAIATRKKSTDPDLLLPGDELTFPVGSGAAKIKLRGTPTIGFYAESRAFETYIPGKTVGVAQAFTAMMTEVDQDARQYADCMTSNSRVHQLVCKALLVRNIGFAGSRFIVHGGLSVADKVLTKALAVIDGSVEFMRWAYYQPQQVIQILHSGTISFSAVTSPPPTSQPVPTLSPVSLDTMCSDEDYSVIRSKNGCPYDGTTTIGDEPFGYSVLIKNNASSVSPSYWDLMDFPAETTCQSITFSFGMPDGGAQPGDVASIEVVDGSQPPQTASVGYGQVGTLTATLDGEPWSLQNSATNAHDEIALNATAQCQTASGY
jgi:hypothetical protein